MNAHPSDQEAACNRLYDYERTRDAFDDSPAMRALFTDSMREMAAFHIRHSQVYRGICAQHGFVPEQVASHDDVIGIPHIFVSAFKEHRLLSVPAEEIYMQYTSSGTQGQKSQINMDRISWERQTGMRGLLARSMGLTSEEPVNCLVFSYAPEITGNRGAANTFAAYAEFAPAREKYFALRPGPDGREAFDVDEAIRMLERYAASGLPLRLVGFLAFSYVTLEEMRRRGLRLRFPAASMLITGGGWKSHTGATVSFEQYAELVSGQLGIDAGNIRDFYGMVEHGVPYLSCSARNYHIPCFANVAAIAPGTLAVLPPGETGLLKLQTSYMRASPSISVLSTDLGAIGADCPCGLPGRYIMLRGRAGVKKHAGCAISASQLIKF